MAKSLSERIAERVSRQKPTGSAKNRAAFLALRPEIKQAINDGWSVKDVWQTLYDEGKVTFSYQAFRGYVNRLLLSQPALVAAEQASPVSGETAGKFDAHTPKDSSKSRPVKPANFTFNSAPKKEDFL